MFNVDALSAERALEFGSLADALKIAADGVARERATIPAAPLAKVPTSAKAAKKARNRANRVRRDAAAISKFLAQPRDTEPCPPPVEEAELEAGPAFGWYARFVLGRRAEVVS